MSKVATLTRKGQITIPVEVRRRLGVDAGDRILLDVEDGRAVLVPIRGTLTEYMHGLGKEMWASAGGAGRYLQEERDSWDDR